MSILAKCAAKNRLSVCRSNGRNSFRPVGQTDKAVPSEIKPDKLRASRLAFVEDFTGEHSLHGEFITSIAISSVF